MGKNRSGANFFITEENYIEIQGPGFWQRHDVPPDRWDQVGGHFGDHEDTLAVFTSGHLPKPVASEQHTAAAGIDWLRIERNPAPGEPDINSYHYVVGMPTSGRYPVWGPYKRGCFVEHWTTESGLDKALGSDE